MPVPRTEFTAEEMRPLSFRDPEEVLDPEKMYTVYEIARLFQGLEPGRDLDPETEAILLDWTIPWMVVNADAFVFVEPASENEPGLYGLATGETAAGGGHSPDT
jgi:hypothetical protein